MVPAAAAARPVQKQLPDQWEENADAEGYEPSSDTLSKLTLVLARLPHLEAVEGSGIQGWYSPGLCLLCLQSV